MMIRKLLLVGSALLMPMAAGAYVLTSGGAAGAGAPTFNNSTDTVNCSTFLGKTTVSPALSLTGSSPTTITVKGKLYGCTDGTGKVSGSETTQTDFGGSVTGTLSGTTNSVATLAGCSNATGTLTIKFKGYYNPGASYEKIEYSSITANLSQIYGALFSPGAPFGNDHVTTDGYGSFQIGANATAAGCTAPTYSGTQAFGGSDNGASTAAVAVTSQDAGAIVDGQANNTSTNVTTLDLGIGALYGG
jgi:hypothetical protein